MKWLSIALLELGDRVMEIPGVASARRILEYHAATTLKATSDEVPWCSAFVCWCMREAGIQSTESAAARSWLHWGTGLAQPRLGCVVVYSRPPSLTDGHVHFWVGERNRIVYGVGGNQGNAVSVGRYPISRVLSYRWPEEV